MNAPKVGDRVRVEFEGEVVDVYGDSGQWCEVSSEGQTANVSTGTCTVIAPPVRVGNKVTEANIDNLPLGSVVTTRSSTVYERWSNMHVSEDWRGTNGDRTDNVVGFKILRVGCES